MFLDRADAGRRLARELSEFAGAPDTVVLGIPRGGVVVAAEVAQALGLPLDIAVAAKVGSPANPEFAIGAVAPDGDVSPNPTAGFSADQVRRLAQPALEKVHRYMESLGAAAQGPDVDGKTVLLVDDGLATGLTAAAATDWLKRQGAETVVVAVPVASAGAVQLLGARADSVRAVEVPRDFRAVGQFYEQFSQTRDAEVEDILQSYRTVSSTRR